MRVFISYNSKDRALVDRVVAGLNTKRPNWTPFYDQQSLAAGYWMPQLAKGVAKAEAFLFLFGERLGPWQTIEYYAAFDRRVKEPNLPITPVLIGDASAPGLPFFHQLQWSQEVDPSAPDALARIVANLERSDGGQPKELWRLVDPYRGLSALREEDAALLYGRESLVAEIVEAVAQPAGKLLVAVGNSGVGKSSLLFAGVFAALARQGWPRPLDRRWPTTLSDSRSWLRLAFPPREDPLKQLARTFVAQWHDPKEATFPTKVDEWAKRLADPRSRVAELVEASDAWAQERGVALPTRYLLYVDQGEELYARAEPKAARRFSSLLTEAVCDDRLRVLLSLRADFYGRLQADQDLFRASRRIDVLPLDRAGVCAVIEGPAQTFGATFEPGVVETLVKATVSEPGGLPLLSYQMEEIWRAMVRRGDGNLCLPSQNEFQIARALVDRADSYLKAHPELEDATRLLFCTRLVHVPAQGAPTRQVALQKDLTAEQRQVVDVLSGGEYRLIMTGENDRGESTAEIGHETLLSAWDRLKNWIGTRRGFYSWLTNLSALRRDYEARPDRKALLQGRQLDIARAVLAQYHGEIPTADVDFIRTSDAAERRTAIGRRRLQISAVILLLAVALVGAAYPYQRQLTVLAAAYTKYRPFVHERNELASLAPKAVFQDCRRGSSDCPEMVIIPGGNFLMGSPGDDPQSEDDEFPQHPVSIQKFSVSKFAITFENWAACTDGGGCIAARTPSDAGWGMGRRPVINISWDDAQDYVSWLSKMTGERYRLLTEAEWEYAARATTTTRYYWSNDVERGHANCSGCGSEWDKLRQTAPVGSFSPNGFELYDMAGNAWQWVQDCYRGTYDDAPSDGSPVDDASCTTRVLRGGSWYDVPRYLRSAFRNGKYPSIKSNGNNSLRVARDLSRDKIGDQAQAAAHSEPTKRSVADLGAPRPPNGRKKAYAVTETATLREVPSYDSRSIRKFAPGAILYPTGKKSGRFSEVTDVNDTKGWVTSALLAPAI